MTRLCRLAVLGLALTLLAGPAAAAEPPAAQEKKSAPLTAEQQERLRERDRLAAESSREGCTA